MGGFGYAWLGGKSKFIWGLQKSWGLQKELSVPEVSMAPKTWISREPQIKGGLCLELVCNHVFVEFTIISL